MHPSIVHPSCFSIQMCVLSAEAVLDTEVRYSHVLDSEVMVFQFSINITVCQGWGNSQTFHYIL